MEAAADLLTSIKDKVSHSTPYSTHKFLSGSKEFLQSNNLVEEFMLLANVTGKIYSYFNINYLLRD